MYCNTDFFMHALLLIPPLIDQVLAFSVYNGLKGFFFLFLFINSIHIFLDCVLHLFHQNYCVLDQGEYSYMYLFNKQHLI